MRNAIFGTLFLIGLGSAAALAVTKDPDAAKASALGASYALVMVVEVNGGGEGYEIEHGLSLDTCRAHADEAIVGPVYQRGQAFASVMVDCEPEA